MYVSIFTAVVYKYGKETNFSSKPQMLAWTSLGIWSYFKFLKGRDHVLLIFLPSKLLTTESCPL